MSMSNLSDTALQYIAEAKARREEADRKIAQTREDFKAMCTAVCEAFGLECVTFARELGRHPAGYSIANDTLDIHTESMSGALCVNWSAFGGKRKLKANSRLAFSKVEYAYPVVSSDLEAARPFDRLSTGLR